MAIYRVIERSNLNRNVALLNFNTVLTSDSKCQCLKYKVILHFHQVWMKKGGLVQVVVLAACEPRGHRFERWSLHIARCVGKTSC